MSGIRTYNFSGNTNYSSGNLHIHKQQYRKPAIYMPWLCGVQKQCWNSTIDGELKCCFLFAAQNADAPPGCNCSTSCSPVVVANSSATPLEEYLVDIRRLSAYRRRHTCADDSRWSSKAMGYTAAFTLVVSVIIIVLSDVIKYLTIYLNRSLEKQFLSYQTCLSRHKTETNHI